MRSLLLPRVFFFFFLKKNFVVVFGECYYKPSELILS